MAGTVTAMFPHPTDRDWLFWEQYEKGYLIVFATVVVVVVFFFWLKLWGRTWKKKNIFCCLQSCQCCVYVLIETIICIELNGVGLSCKRSYVLNWIELNWIELSLLTTPHFRIISPGVYRWCCTHESNDGVVWTTIIALKHNVYLLLARGPND